MMTLETFEPKNGGKWRYIHTDQHGNAYAFHGVYHEVLAPELIFDTFEFEGLPEKGHVGLETVTFEELPGGRIKLTSQAVFQSVADRDGMLQSGAEEGVTDTYERLAELLKKWEHLRCGYAKSGGEEITMNQQKPLMTSILWTFQALLALLFLLVGAMKLIVPVQALLAQMPIQMPGLFVRFIGFVEVAGALGLILPGLLRIRPMLTPLAAGGLVIEMMCATIYTVIGGQGVGAVLPLVLGLLCAFVAYGRRSWATR